ncbi:MAG: plasmid pRiA4b ORF-3 family protein [Bryobacteraceae bacterium]
MNQTTSLIEIYQFRVVLRETSPHIWRRLLVPSDSTLITFHRVIQAAFGWSGRRSFSCNVQGDRQQAASVGDPRLISLCDLRLYVKERFTYDEENTAGMSRPWRFQIRLEKKLPKEERGHYPRCIGGSGAPPPEDCGGTIAFENLRDLFTPDYIVHRLAEMLDEGWKPEHVAELGQLRPWMDRALARRDINRRLRHQTAASAEGGR